MKNIKKVGLVYALLLGTVTANAGKLYTVITPTSPDNEITLPNEAREVFANKNIEYNLDPSVPSPFGNYTGAKIIYKPDPGTLKYMDYFVLSLSNAYFSNKIAKCWFVFYENNGLDTDDDGIGDTSYDLTNDGDTNDSVVVAETVKIEKNTALFRVMDYKPPRYKRFNPKSLLYLACAEHGEPFVVDENRDFSGPPAEFNEMYNAVIKFKKPSGTPIIIRDRYKSSICVEVLDAFTCCPYRSITQLRTKEKTCFINFKNQFSIDMTPAVSYINTYPDLNSTNCSNSKSGLIKCYLRGTEVSHRFVPTGSSILDSDTCTEEHASSGWITINNNPDNDIDDPVHLSPTGWKGKISVEMYDMNRKYRCDNSPQGYKGLDFNRMFIDNNGVRNSNASGDPTYDRGLNDIPINSGISCTAEAFVYEIGTPSEDTVIAPLVTGWEDDIYIGVRSDEYLKMVRWGLKYTFSILDNDNNEVYKYVLTESDESILRKVDKLSCCYDNDFAGYFLLWKPNGDEAYIPYMLNSNMFRVVISNNSCWNAEVYARVWDSKGRVVDNVYLGTVGKNSVKILTGDYIFKRAKQFNPFLGKKTSPLYSVILTVGAPKRDVEFAAYDNRSGKAKMIPVYDLNSHEWTYKNVDFDTDGFEQ